MHERERELNDIVLRRFLRRANFKWLPTGRVEGWVGAYKGEQTSSAAAAANKQQYKEKQSSSSTKAASPAPAAAANCRLNPVLSGPQLCDPHHVAISYFVPSSVFMLFAFSYLANLVWTQIM